MVEDGVSFRQRIEAAKAGDDSAFGALVGDISPRLMLFIRRIAGSAVRADADEQDLLQDTLLRAHGQLRNYDHRNAAGFYRWLTSFARHATMNRLSYLDGKGRRHVRHIESVATAEGFVPPASPASSPSRHVARREEVDHLRIALDQLPPDLRGVVEAKIIDGLSLAEIGALTHTPKSSVFDRLHEGMVRLERIMRSRGATSSR